MESRKKQKTPTSNSQYFDIDLGDNVEEATYRLFPPFRPKKSNSSKKSNDFGCFLRCFKRGKNDSTSDSDFSFSEPLSPF